MEGLGGVATHSQVMMEGVEYERARQWMAHEANACIDGAASAGARRFCVNDSHGTMHNIFADDVDPRAELLVGTAKPWSMGQGIDGGYDTCFFIGYHARPGHPRAVLDHTYASRAIYECNLNRTPVGETTLNAYLAGYFDASVTLVAGERATVSRERCSPRNGSRSFSRSRRRRPWRSLATRSRSSRKRATRSSSSSS